MGLELLIAKKIARQDENMNKIPPKRYRYDDFSDFSKSTISLNA